MFACQFWVALLLAAAPVGGLRGGEDTTDLPALPARPNLILIVCDNLGYGDIEPFGSELHRTPALNRMAAEGLRFTQFYVTAGVCTASRASIMTGCYAQRVGLHHNPRDGLVLRPLSPYGLHPAEVTVAELLKSSGYATALIGKWHLGDQLEFLPTAQGFDLFFGIPYSDDMTAAAGRQLGDRFDGRRWPPLPLMRNETVIEAPVDRNQLTSRYTAQAVQWIEQHRDHPFFLYLAHAMPGSTPRPFASERFRGRSRNGPWGDSVEELDWSTGEILAALRRWDLQERTLVVWTSDNGAPLAANPELRTRGSNRPLHGRGYTTAEGAFRVPTLMWWPGVIPADRTCAELVSTLDLLPTFAALAGAEPPRDRRIDGHNITALLRGVPTAKSPYTHFCYYQEAQLQAIRRGPWKLFLPLQQATRHPHFSAGRSDHALLFDVVHDPGSTRDVAAEHPEIVQELRQLAVRIRSDLGDSDRPGNGQRPAGHVDRVTPRTK